jgi:hypothetical protein
VGKSKLGVCYLIPNHAQNAHAAADSSSLSNKVLYLYFVVEAQPSVFYRTNAYFQLPRGPLNGSFPCHIQSAHTRQSSAQSSPSLPCCPFGSHDIILAGLILDAEPIYQNHPVVQIAQCRWQSYYVGRISLVSNDLDGDAWVGCDIRFPPATLLLTTRQHHDMSGKRLCTWRKVNLLGRSQPFRVPSRARHVQWHFLHHVLTLIFSFAFLPVIKKLRI